MPEEKRFRVVGPVPQPAEVRKRRVQENLKDIEEELKENRKLIRENGEILRELDYKEGDELTKVYHQLQEDINVLHQIRMGLRG